MARRAPSSKRRADQLARWAGIILQGLILGLLLALAFVTLSSWSGGLAAFRYEAF